MRNTCDSRQARKVGDALGGENGQPISVTYLVLVARSGGRRQTERSCGGVDDDTEVCARDGGIVSDKMLLRRSAPELLESDE